MQRLLFDYGNPQEKTLIIAIAAIHGNEPAGLKALQSLYDHLRKNDITLQGRLVGLLGNIQALHENRRFLHEDLNRIWSEANISLARQRPDHSPELWELAQIFNMLDAIQYHQYTHKIFLDLHTTSGENGTFVVACDYTSSKPLLQDICMPIVLGLEEKLENTAIRYMQRQGFCALAIEGGLHTSKSSVDHLLWGIWKILHNTTLVNDSKIPQLSEIKDQLSQRTAHLPAILEVDYLHNVALNDEFVMKPGFKNFDRVEQGQLLAKDKRGQIYAKKSGYLLMPLYQKEGNDGFFIVNQALQEDWS
ncbi:MAG: succinylglutamate desuccinylase/aspartoacylase family protein [Microscillaceae bacterium]|nr:succinylglutamate desuccinylase/aspartoacylase family protein [Microscillaceae bacterium]